jgi:hypothetical protein
MSRICGLPNQWGLLPRTVAGRFNILALKSKTAGAIASV